MLLSDWKLRSKAHSFNTFLSHGPARAGSRKFALLTIYHTKYSVPDCGILETFHTWAEHEGWSFHHFRVIVEPFLSWFDENYRLMAWLSRAVLGRGIPEHLSRPINYRSNPILPRMHGAMLIRTIQYQRTQRIRPSCMSAPIFEMNIPLYRVVPVYVLNGYVMSRSSSLEFSPSDVQ